MKPQPDHTNISTPFHHGGGVWWWPRYKTEFPVSQHRNPHGVPGDLLYVRETWCGHWGPITQGMREPSLSLTDAEIPQKNGRVSHATPDNPLHLYYRATWGDEPPLSHIKWRPSVHMFKWAARLWVRNTGVRVEQGPAISEADAKAEGFESADAFMAWWAKQYPGMDWRFVTEYEVTER